MRSRCRRRDSVISTLRAYTSARLCSNASCRSLCVRSSLMSPRFSSARVASAVATGGMRSSQGRLLLASLSCRSASDSRVGYIVGSGRYSNHKPSLRALQLGLLRLPLVLLLLAPRRPNAPAVDARTSMLLRAR